MADDESVVRSLRRRWKPVKQRLNGEREDHPTAVRFHRCCSWMVMAERAESAGDADARLLGQWIAFNALYGQWDPVKRDPVGDRRSWRLFLERVLTLDHDGHVTGMLRSEQQLVLAILDDAYLAQFFWNNPSRRRASEMTKARREAPLWFAQQRFARLLEETVERVYLLRCQVLHGAATHGGTLNRDSMRRCGAFMQQLLPAVLGVWIDHGSDENWGPMCYPPMR